MSELAQGVCHICYSNETGGHCRDCPRSNVPTWASNREPNASPCDRILAALVKVPAERLAELAGHVERLAGWDRQIAQPFIITRESRPARNIRDAQATDELEARAKEAAGAGPRL
jgi:hypothetical protein